MTNILGSVCQRLKGRMSLQIALTFLLVSLVLPDTTSALFYTNSKEHDYPRIGRRSGPGPDVDALTESEELDTYQKHARDDTTLKHSRFIADAAFRTWDTNGDGFLSRNEFWPKLIRRGARSP